MSDLTHTGYRMDYKCRGQAIIIVNETFDDKTRDRHGAGADLKKMAYLFNSLDFFCDNVQELIKYHDHRENIESDTKKNKKSDCFVLVISSHGVEMLDDGKEGVCDKTPTIWRHAVVGTDNKPVYVDKITNMFEDTEDDANGLNGKPKLFFLQACRSQAGKSLEDPGLYDLGFVVDVLTAIGQGKGKAKDSPDSYLVDQHNAPISLTTRTEASDDCSETCQVFGSVEDIYSDWDMDTDTVNVLADVITKGTEAEDTGDARGSPDSGTPLPPLPPTSYDVVPIYCPKDCLIFYPVQPHKIAMHNPVSGSWMLHYLHIKKNLVILLEGRGLMQYLTAVTGDMAKYDSGIIKEKAKMAATIVHRLTGDVKFVKKTDKTIMAKLVDYFKKRL